MLNGIIDFHDVLSGTYRTGTCAFDGETGSRASLHCVGMGRQEQSPRARYQ